MAETMMASQDAAAGSLKGELGALDIALATLAYAGPLTGTAGYITYIIGYGNGLGAPLTFIAVMIAFLLFSVGYSAQARFVPNPGAFYAYITAGIGRSHGLGSSFLILGSYLSIGVGFYGFAGIITKQFVENLIGPLPLDWWAYSLIYWAAVGTLAYFHVAISAKVLGVLLVAEVAIVFFFDFLVMSSGGREGVSFQVFSLNAFTSGQLGIAFIFGAALFCGFEATAIYREETRDPERTIPRATYAVVLFIGIFYAITSWALITALGNSKAVELSLADPSNAFFNVAKEFGGKILFDLVSVLLLTSTFAAHLSIQNVTTRYVYSLSVDGVFPRVLGVAHPRHASPSRASVCVSFVYLLLTGMLVLTGLSAEQIYSWFAGLASFSILLAMTVTSISAFVYFRRNPAADVNAWQGLVAPALSSIALAIMVSLGVYNFASLINGSQGLANIMLALITSTYVIGFFYARYLRSAKPAVFARIGRQ